MLRFRRKIVPVFVSSLLTFALIPMTASSSQAVTVGEFWYSVTGSTATVNGCSDLCPADLVIPAKVPETKISVTSISEYAFAGNGETGLVFASVTLPDSIVSIKAGAFNGVKVNTDFTLPSKLNSIGSSAFSNSDLTKISFGSAITYIGPNAFSGASIDNPSDLTMQSGEIKNSAFEGISFNKVTLGANFSSIGNNAFAKMEGLGAVSPRIDTLSIGGGDIAQNAFSETRIGDVTLGSSIGTIGYSAFSGPRVDYDMDTETYMYVNPIARGKLTINSGIVESNAFFNSTFSSVTIGKSVSYVGTNAFGGAYQTPVSKRPNLGFVSIDARYIAENSFSDASMSRLTLGTNVAYVGPSAFGSGTEDVTSLGNVVINGGIFSSGAFSNVQATSTVINSTVKNIKENSFAYNGEVIGGSNNLGALTIDAPKIAEYGFYNVDATSLTFGSNVKSIGDYAFGGFSISNPSPDVNLNAEVIGDYSFEGSNIAKVQLGSKVRSIGQGAFAGIATLKNVTIDAGEIGSQAFQSSGIETLVIGSGVTKVGNFAFGAAPLSSLDIANGVGSIGQFAFSGPTNDEGDQCTGISSLSTVKIPNSVVSVGYGAFSCLVDLTAISFGTGLNYLEDAIYDNPLLGELSFYGKPPVDIAQMPNQSFTLRHTASNTTAWNPAFSAINGGRDFPITRNALLAQPTFTYTSATAKPDAKKIAIKASYVMGSPGKAQLTVTQSGSKKVLCTTTVQTRDTSNIARSATCNLSKAIRDGLKKKALALNVTLTYYPDLGDTKPLNKALTIGKQ